MKSQKGFTAPHIIVSILVIGLVVGTGVLIYTSKKDTKQASIKGSNNSDVLTPNVGVTDFESCKKAGNPIQESYPEVCRAKDGKTYPNPSQIKEEDSWLLFAPLDKAYTVRVPDGWQAVALYDNLYVRDVSKLAYKKGIKATVQVMNEGGWDGSSPFSLYFPRQNADQIVKEGTKEGTLTTQTGLIVEKYHYLQETEPEGIGYQKGAHVYNYYFGAEGKFIQVQHVAGPEDAHQFKLVERVVETITVK